GLGRLVDVVELEELSSNCADVADLEHGFAGDLLLDVQVEVLHVRRANVGVDDEEIAKAAEAGVDGVSLGNLTDSTALGKRSATRARVRRTGAEAAVPGQVAEKHVLREGVVEDAPAGADHGLAVAGEVVGEGEAGSEVVAVWVVET